MVVRVLSKAGYQVVAERVETAAEMREALARERFHVVLADYQLPQFDAPAALAVLRESGQDLPFLVVSGVVGEETATEMMRRGAHDYVMKDHLARLAPVVERELAEAQGRRERQAAERALRQSEERFRTLFLEAPIGLVLMDEEARLIDVNRAFSQMLEYDRDDLVSRTVAEITHPDDRPAVAEQYEALRRGAGNYHAEKRYLRKDGTAVWVSKTATGIRDGDGSFLYGLGMIEDITEGRRAQEALRRSESFLNSIVDQSPTPCGSRTTRA